MLNTNIRLTMLCLSGFELYSRWVPLIDYRVKLLRERPMLSKQREDYLNLKKLSLNRQENERSFHIVRQMLHITELQVTANCQKKYELSTSELTKG